MSDTLITVSLPRSYVERLRSLNAVNARLKRRSANATETNAPGTKRNAKAVAQWRAEADESELIAANCALALAAPGDVEPSSSEAGS